MTTNAMRSHSLIVQFHFTYEGLLPFSFTPRTNHLHDVSWPGKVNVEDRTTINRQIPIIKWGRRIIAGHMTKVNVVKSIQMWEVAPRWRLAVCKCAGPAIGKTWHLDL